MDFIQTIGDDVEISEESEDSSSDEEAVAPRAFPSNKRVGHSSFDTQFEFAERSLLDEVQWTDGLENFVHQIKKSTLDEKIAEVRKDRRKKDAEAKEDDDGNEKEKDEAETEEKKEDESSDEDEDVGISEVNDQWDQVKNKASSEKWISKKMKDEEEEEPTDFFKEAPIQRNKITSFEQMNLSRPLLKAITSMHFRTPTPIQTMTIPLALLGKDICACAATGTGKTAAFILPVLERLIYKPRQSPISRVLVLVPTRELGVQVFQVTKHLGQFMEVEVCLAVGGLEVRLQEAALRKGPDIIIATPGRLIDHLHNTPSFGLGGIEILILDEADRMLDEHFGEQMQEIIKMCSMTRQTMLFSATMTDKVKDLAIVSLKEPVKVFVNENTEVAYNLRQEFVRIRKQREGDREAIVAALCCRTFHDHCLVFVQTKKEAHHLHVLLGLLGLNVGELHGNLKQPKRLESLRRFKEAQIDIMVATDLAARGLDIEGVKTVINLTMPNTLQHYVHRVGRTARAGKIGRSVSLIGESERKMLKEVVKLAKTAVKSRTVPTEVIQKYRDRIDGMEDDIKKIFKMEWEEKQLQITESQVHKAEKILQHHEEVFSRPKRNWFQNYRERLRAEKATRLQEGEKGKRGRKTDEETADERMEQELKKSQLYAARFAKRSRKGSEDHVAKKQKKDSNPFWFHKMNLYLRDKGKRAKKTSFSRELTGTSKPTVREIRNRAVEFEKEVRLEHRQEYMNRKQKRPNKKGR